MFQNKVMDKYNPGKIKIVPKSPKFNSSDDKNYFKEESKHNIVFSKSTDRPKIIYSPKKATKNTSDDSSNKSSPKKKRQYTVKKLRPPTKSPGRSVLVGFNKSRSYADKNLKKEEPKRSPKNKGKEEPKNKKPKRSPRKEESSNEKPKRIIKKNIKTPRRGKKYTEIEEDYKDKLKLRLRDGKNKIKLIGEQNKHVEELEDILSNDVSVVLSNSETGSGKTFISSVLFLKSGLPNLLVIAPAAAKHTWLEFSSKYAGIDPLFISFGKLSGMGNKQPKNGLLKRMDIDKDGKKVKKTTINKKITKKINPTKNLIKMIKEGLFIIVDEYQGIRNNSGQSIAITSIFRTMHKINQDERTNNKGELIYKDHEKRSRGILLSATPFQKEVSAIRVLRAVGIIKKGKMFGVNPQYPSAGNVFLGFQDLIDKARHFEKIFDMSQYKKLDDILNQYPHFSPQNGADMNKISYEIFIEIILPVIGRSLAKPTPPPGIKHNLLYKISKLQPNLEKMYLEVLDKITDSSAKLRKAIRNLNILKINLSRLENENNPDIIRRINLLKEKISMLRGVISRGQHYIEILKSELFTREAAKVLEENPKSKVIIMLNYTTTITYIQEKLIKYNPLILAAGSTKNKTNIIRSFQEHNTKYRLLISNIMSGGVSASYHDENGKYPRTLFISPKYSAIDLTQAAGRVDRLGAMSSSNTFFLYTSPIEIFNKYTIDPFNFLKDLYKNEPIELSADERKPIIESLTNEIAIAKSGIQKGKVIRDNLSGDYYENAKLPDKIATIDFTDFKIGEYEFWDDEGFLEKRINNLIKLFIEWDIDYLPELDEEIEENEISIMDTKNKINKITEVLKNKLIIKPSILVKSNYGNESSSENSSKDIKKKVIKKKVIKLSSKSSSINSSSKSSSINSSSKSSSINSSSKSSSINSSSKSNSKNSSSKSSSINSSSKSSSKNSISDSKKIEEKDLPTTYNVTNVLD